MTIRNQKLYKQLDELDGELKKNLIDQLEREASGKSSMFISRLMSSLYDGKTYQGPDVKHIEDVANKVISLKEKLKEPLSDGATGVITKYMELKEKRLYLYGQDRTDFARSQLSILGIQQTATVAAIQSPRPRKNRDNISKPAKGRYFPISVSDAVQLIQQLAFHHSDYRERIDLSFVNPETESSYGTRIAAFYPSDEIIIFSFEDSFPKGRASAHVVSVLKEFFELDSGTASRWNRQKSTSFRAYVNDKKEIIITRRERSAKLTKYRSGSKFSNAYKPKGIQTAETIIKQIEII